MRELYEKAGLFYLGRYVEPEEDSSSQEPALLKSADLTTHAVIIGMTGSGKSGLGIALIEEAAIDNIPSIVIDPKGDMGNLCLVDSSFSVEKFARWTESEARSAGVDPLEYAKSEAEKWREGLNRWDQDAQRVARYESVEKVLYTPGSSIGVSIDITDTLSLPPSKVLEDEDLFSSYLGASVSGILSLAGDFDEGGREYLLCAHIVMRAWMDGRGITLEEMVSSVLKPPFRKIGVMPLDSFYPEKDRFELASALNGVIASPKYLSWMRGEPLDMEKMLYDENGKARISIFNISQLDDRERMFFVTTLLNRYTAWMRMQSGSSRLKSIVYMDEIYGYFPPVGNPPSKTPMLTLLKQARAYGTGVILSTQNPVDLDYRGLSNIGTWFLGRLQTAQDLKRVSSGLESAGGDAREIGEIESMLSSMPSRRFLLRSTRRDSLDLFDTRWVMSYLKGPLDRDEISELKSEEHHYRDDLEPAKPISLTDGEYLPTIPSLQGVIQRFERDISGTGKFIPQLCASATVHFTDSRRGIDMRENVLLSLDIASMQSLSWDESEESDEFTYLGTKPPANGRYRILPRFVESDRGLKAASRELVGYLYHNRRLKLYRCKSPKLESTPGESESRFRARVSDELAEKKAEALTKLEERYRKKEELLRERISRAMERVEKEESDRVGSVLDAGISLIGAIFGGGRGASIGTTIRRGGKILKESGDLTRARKRVEELKEKLDDLIEELSEKIEELDDKYSIDRYEIEEFFIRPRKGDISIDEMAIVWRVEYTGDTRDDSPIHGGR